MPCQFPGCSEPAPVYDAPAEDDNALRLCLAHNQLWWDDQPEFRREWDACTNPSD